MKEEKNASRQSYGEALLELGKSNKNVVVLDADLAGATKSGIFLKEFPNREKTKLKNIIKVFFIFLIIHSIIPLFLGKANNELTWSTWRNPRNIYINFNDNNKSKTITGIYEYSVRNFYKTFIKAK